MHRAITTRTRSNDTQRISDAAADPPWPIPSMSDPPRIGKTRQDPFSRVTNVVNFIPRARSSHVKLCHYRPRMHRSLHSRRFAIAYVFRVDHDLADQPKT